MANIIDFFKVACDKTPFNLREDRDRSKGKKKSVFATTCDCYIVNVKEEDFVLKGLKKKIKRVFIGGDLIGEYTHLGWVINSELDNCMICAKPFDVSRYRHHCHACGNLVCVACSANTAVVAEIEVAGPLRVCDMCFWGQEIVVAAANFQLDKIPGGMVYSTTPTAAKIVTAPDHQRFLDEIIPRLKRSVHIQKNFELSELLNKFVAAAAVAAAPSAASGRDFNGMTRGNGAVPSAGSVNFDKSNPSERLKVFLSFGPLVEVTPKPNTVIKIKRPASASKVFINLTGHPDVPYFIHDSSDPTQNANSPSINIFINAPVKQINPRDKQECTIYDVVVHPDEIDKCAIDATSNTRQKLLREASRAIKDFFGDDLGQQFNVINIKTNYQNFDPSFSVRSVALPAKNAFHSLHYLTTSPFDIAASQLSKPIVELPDLRTTSVSSKGSATKFSSIDFQTLDTSQLVYVKPNDVNEDTSEQNPAVVQLENFINSTNGSFIRFEDVLIYAEKGFCIRTSMLHKSTYVFINVCHHPQVGIVSKSVANRETISDTCPLIIASYSTNVPYQEDDMVILVSTMDVILPSETFLNAVLDQTGKGHEKLATDIVKQLISFHAPCDGAFNLPVINGGYIASIESASESARLSLQNPSINFTERERRLYQMLFFGKLFKQGHRYATWKERIFVLQANCSLTYYEFSQNSSTKQISHCSCKGEFNFDDGKIEYCKKEVSNAPPNSFPFRIETLVNGGEFMNCYSLSGEHRTSLSGLFVATIQHRIVLKDLKGVPFLVCGELRKQGHIVKTWKKRFFVLNYGVMSYYDHNGCLNANGSRENKLGEIDLYRAEVLVHPSTVDNVKIEPNQIYIFETVNRRKYFLETTVPKEKKFWFDAIKAHQVYATTNDTRTSLKK